jgi:DNA-binding NarL/FixJ family response regulator
MEVVETAVEIRVLCADDHPIVRKGIASLLAGEPDIRLVAEASGGRQAVEMYRLHQPDVTLMDLRMPDLDGIAAARQIRREFPAARIIALTSYDGDQDICQALDAGIRGYLLKEMIHNDVLNAIRSVHSGKRVLPAEVSERLHEYFPEIALTPREVEVLRFVAEGMGNKDIADRLGMAAGTVKMHVQNILGKLGALDRTHAVSIAFRRGIFHVS